LYITVLAEYQSFTKLKYHQNHAEKIMDFEHPIPRGILHPNIQLGVQKTML